MINRCLYTLNRRLLRLILFIMGIVVFLHVMKTYWRSRGIEPLIRNFGTREVSAQLHGGGGTPVRNE